MRPASAVEPIALGVVIVADLLFNTSTGNQIFLYAFFGLAFVYVPIALRLRKMSLVAHFGLKKALTPIGALYFAAPIVTLVASYLMALFPLVSQVQFQPLVISDVASPVAEESIYRGYIYGTLRRYNKLAAAFISTFLFFLPHARYGIPLDIEVLVFGLIFVWLFEYTGSILPSIVGHIGFNVVVEYQTLFGGVLYSTPFGLTLPSLAVYLFAYAPFISLLVGAEILQKNISRGKRCWICGRTIGEVRKEVPGAPDNFFELKVEDSLVRICPICKSFIGTSGRREAPESGNEVE